MIILDDPDQKRSMAVGLRIHGERIAPQAYVIR
jgi:hypothetical protein